MSHTHTYVCIYVYNYKSILNVVYIDDLYIGMDVMDLPYTVCV